VLNFFLKLLTTLLTPETPEQGTCQKCGARAGVFVASATPWEVRTGSTDTNGGAFVTGASGLLSQRTTPTQPTGRRPGGNKTSC
jgi:hypothetical protein